jgi:hypothetical protein
MSAVPQIGPQILPGGQTQVDPALVTQELLRAAQNAATKSLSAQGQDTKDFAIAALNFAQAVVVLDPSLSQGGTPLQHDLAIKSMDHQAQATVASIQGDTAVRVEQVRGDNALRQARETAAAPTPRKTKTVAVQRDQSGRAAAYSVSEN